MPVLIEAVHTVKPLTDTAFDQYVDWYGEVAMPAMRRSGFEVLGAWKRTGGPMGQDVLLARFEDMGAYERAGAALRSDRAFVEAMSRRPSSFVISESTKICVPVSYATEQRLQRALSERPAKPRQYLQAVLRGPAAGLPRAYELIGQLADRLEAAGMLLATAYETRVGERGEFTDIWVLPGGVPDLSYRPGDRMPELIGQLREVAPEESTYYLNPLPYSPLQ